MLAEALETADKFFSEVGYSDGKMGAPVPTSADAPFFQARSAEVLAGLRRHARIEMAETGARLEVVEGQIAKEEAEFGPSGSRQQEKARLHLELPSRLGWVYWLFFLFVLAGEIPYAYMTFSDALGIEMEEEESDWMNMLLPICGAIGFVGSTAAVKVLVDWWLNRMPKKIGEKWGIFRVIPMVLVVSAGMYVFVNFAMGVGTFRENLGVKKAFEAYQLNESYYTGDSTHIPDTPPPKPDAQAFSDSTRDFFTCFGLFFPLAAAVLGIEAETRSRRRRILSVLEKQAAAPPDATQVMRGFELEARKVAHARAEALFESFQDANEQADWHHRFWLVYRSAYLKGQYDPERFNEGPGLYEKVEAYRMKLN